LLWPLLLPLLLLLKQKLPLPKKHQLKASDIKLWAQQLGQFLQNVKRPEHKTKSVHSGMVPKINRAIENHALLQLINYLTWVDDLVIEDYIYDVFELLNEPAVAYYDFFYDYLRGALKDVGVDLYDVTNEYYYSLEDDFILFLDEADAFWKTWVDDPEHIPENLLIHIPQIQKYLKAYGTKTLNHFVTLMNLCWTLLTPDVLEEVYGGAQIALVKTGVAIDNLFAALKPPTDIVSPPANVTLESFLGFFPYLGELNVTSIIFDGLSTIQELRELRRGFNDDLVAIFGEAAGVDLENQGQNITGTFEVALDTRFMLNRLALDNLVYSWFYGLGWDFLYRLGDIVQAYFDTFEEIPPVALETIIQLEGLVETLAPEYQQRASDLVTQALQKTDTIVKKYLEVFKPKQ